MSIFDDLEQLLHEFVLRSAESDSPKWIAQLLNIKIENRPSLLGNFSIQSLQKKEAHYLGMRNYLLCQQTILSIHLYQHKMKSNDAAPSLRSDCAVDVLKRTLVTIESVKEFNTLMNVRSLRTAKPNQNQATSEYARRGIHMLLDVVDGQRSFLGVQTAL